VCYVEAGCAIWFRPCATLAGILIDTDLQPDPCDAGFYVCYVEICRQAGVDPASPERVRELVSKWNQMLTDKPAEQPH
jgi:hypothetical protein